jgi:hypothetical protein
VDWLRARCVRLTDLLETLCEELHVEFQPFEPTVPKAQYRDLWQPDHMHLNTAGHEMVGPGEGELMIRAWRRART